MFRSLTVSDWTICVCVLARFWWSMSICFMIESLTSSKYMDKSSKQTFSTWIQCRFCFFENHLRKPSKVWQRNMIVPREELFCFKAMMKVHLLTVGARTVFKLDTHTHFNYHSFFTLRPTTFMRVHQCEYHRVIPAFCTPLMTKMFRSSADIYSLMIPYIDHPRFWCRPLFSAFFLFAFWWNQPRHRHAPRLSSFRFRREDWGFPLLVMSARCSSRMGKRAWSRIRGLAARNVCSLFFIPEISETVW